MKRIVFILFIFTAHHFWAQSSFSSLIENEKKSFLSSHNASTCAVSDNYDVKYYRCRWNIDPAVNMISGNITTYFKPQSPIDSLQMDASISLSIDSVLYHNSKINFSQLTGDVLQIHFPTSLTALDSITVFYHGVPPSSGFGSFTQSTHGPNHDPIIWTLSEPYGARDWWPCKMTLTDKADSIDTYITIPSGNKAASNGLLKEIIPQGANYTYHWKHRHPIAAYLIAQAVTNYTSYTDTAQLQNGTLPVLYYVYPEDSTGSRTTDKQLLKVIHYYDSLFIPYSFSNEKYGHAQFGWGGGMEHQTMSFVGSFAIDLLAHELAHQWFGDRVTCGTWRDIWLNEGFAVYCTAISLTTLFGEQYFIDWRNSTSNNVTSISNGSVYVDDTTSVARVFDNRLTYNKGAYLLHMLRCMLGDSLFFQGLRNYLNDPTLAYSFAKTAMLQQHLENVSGQSLTTFFQQWFYGQGFPSYLVLYNQDANNQLKITLNQSTSDNSVSFFEMPVPIEFKGKGKDTTIIFNHTSSGQVFYVNLNFSVDSIFLDPDLHILSAHNKVMNEFAYLRSLQSLVVYPNPTTDIVNVEINDFSNFPRSVELYNVLGEKITSFTPAGNIFSVPLTNLAIGTYYLKIISEDNVYTHKIIKEN
jgi:aminopeptidase N